MSEDTQISAVAGTLFLPLYGPYAKSPMLRSIQYTVHYRLGRPVM